MTACWVARARSKTPATAPTRAWASASTAAAPATPSVRGKPSAFRGTMWLNSANHGALAVKILLASIKDGTALPVQSFTDPEYITAANFASDYKAKLCK